MFSSCRSQSQILKMERRQGSPVRPEKQDRRRVQFAGSFIFAGADGTHRPPRGCGLPAGQCRSRSEAMRNRNDSVYDEYLLGIRNCRNASCGVYVADSIWAGFIRANIRRTLPAGRKLMIPGPHLFSRDQPGAVGRERHVAWHCPSPNGRSPYHRIGLLIG